jgi:uncharacterized protein YuzE
MPTSEPIAVKTSQTTFRFEGQTVRVNYYPETKSVYIHLADRVSAETEEVRDGVMLDFDAEGHLIGIGIDKTDTLPGFDPHLELVRTNA